MATEGLAAPVAVAKQRSSWAETLVGQLLALLASLGIALLAGSVLIVAYGESPATVYSSILDASMGSADGIGYVLAIATPLIFSALAVAVCFKGGLFNIGVEGQYLVAMVTAAWAEIELGFLPGPILVVVVLLAAMLGGMIWAAVPGILKVKTGAHEVVTTIMLNYIALYLLFYLLSVPGFQAEGSNQAISIPIDATARFPRLFGSGLSVNGSLVVALLAALACWWLLTRSTLGFRLRAVGANQFAARTAGMNVARSYVIVMLIAGALSGLAGAAQALGGNNVAITGDVDANIGFDAITVALLGRASPGGTVWAGILFGALRAGSVRMQAETGVPTEIVQVIQSVIVLFIAAPALIREIFHLRESRGGGVTQLAKGWNG